MHTVTSLCNMRVNDNTVYHFIRNIKMCCIVYHVYEYNTTVMNNDDRCIVIPTEVSALTSLVRLCAVSLLYFFLQWYCTSLVRLSVSN